jgi:outer membrane protein assembly factor BamB
MPQDTLYIGTNGHVAAIDTANGNERWRTKLGQGFTSTAQADVTILLDGDRLLAGSMGHLYCIDATNGAVVWQNDLEGLGYNDITMAMAGTSVQITTRAQR